MYFKLTTTLVTKDSTAAIIVNPFLMQVYKSLPILALSIKVPNSACWPPFKWCPLLSNGLNLVLTNLMVVYAPSQNTFPMTKLALSTPMKPQKLSTYTPSNDNLQGRVARPIRLQYLSHSLILPSEEN